jgi:hypothetical protein
MKRILVLLAVVALLIGAIALPAFAQPPGPPGDINIAYFHACNNPGNAPFWCP